MFGFMLGVLGSALFWVGFFLVSLFGAGITMRHFAPNTFRFVTTGENDGVNSRYNKNIVGALVATAILHMIFWIFIVAWVIFKFLMKTIFMTIAWPLFCNGIKTTTNLVPDIQIKVNENK